MMGEHGLRPFILSSGSTSSFQPSSNLPPISRTPDLDYSTNLADLLRRSQPSSAASTSAARGHPSAPTWSASYFHRRTLSSTTSSEPSYPSRAYLSPSMSSIEAPEHRSGFSTPNSYAADSPSPSPLQPSSPVPSEKGMRALILPPASKELDYSGTPAPAKPQSSRKRVKYAAVAVGLLVVVGAVVGAAVGVTTHKKHVELTSLSGVSSGSGSSIGASTANGASSAGVSQQRPSSTVAAVAAGPSQTAARRIVVFGASYCDNGHARASKYSASLKSSPYYEGRESNGIVWDEYLAQLIAPAGTTTDMRNYAYSGAMVDNSISSAAVPDTKSQIASYLSDIQSGLVPTIAPRTLVAVWVGLNPIISSWSGAVNGNLSTSANNNAIQTINNTANALLNQLSGLRSSLLSSSIKADFLVLPLPPTELLPFAIAAGQKSGKSLGLLQTLTSNYNAILSAGLTKFTNTDGTPSYTYDIPSLYHKVVSTPSVINATDSTSSCVSGSSACSNPSSHVWWDSVHMTTVFHQYVAQNLLPVVLPIWS